MIDWTVVVLPIVGAFALALAAWVFARVMRRPLQDPADEASDGSFVGMPASSALMELMWVPLSVVVIMGQFPTLSLAAGSLLCFAGHLWCARLAKDGVDSAVAKAILRRGRLYLAGVVIFGAMAILHAVPRSGAL